MVKKSSLVLRSKMFQLMFEFFQQSAAKPLDKTESMFYNAIE